MKEYSSETGGRYTYIDDIINLQDLAGVFSAIFDGCEGFIVSGCEPDGNSIAEGYVWLEGKIRKFNRTDTTTKGGVIYVHNTVDLMPYANGTTKVGRTEYGCAWSAALPTVPDDVTGSYPSYIQLDNDNNGLRMREAFFGKYALLKDTVASPQDVEVPVVFKKHLGVNGILKIGKSLAFEEGQLTANVSYHNGSLDIDAINTDGGVTTLSVKEDGKLYFDTPAVRCLIVGRDKANFFVPVESEDVFAGDVRITDSRISIYQQPVDTACLDINMTGCMNGSDFFRSTAIGNGKGTALAVFNGLENCTYIYSKLKLNGHGTADIAITTDATTTAKQTGVVSWLGTSSQQVAAMGYLEDAFSRFELKNYLGDLHLRGKGAVDLGPVIRENGTALSQIYYKIADATRDLQTKADLEQVYSKDDADAKFAVLDGGLAQFLGGDKTGADLCAEIGALTTDGIADCALKSMFLADVAPDEQSKKKVRDNIDVYSKAQTQPVLSDTGWVSIAGTTLFARQWGKMVFIEGVFTPDNACHNPGTVAFNVPNSIDPPSQAVGGAFHVWGAKEKKLNSFACCADAGARVFKTVFCSACGERVHMSITYIA